MAVRLDLRAQLALQVALGVAALAVVVVVLRAYVVQQEVERTARSRLAVSQVLANYVDAQLADQLQQLARTAARLPQAAPGAPAPLVEDLRSRLEPTVYGIFLLDGAGAPLAADPIDAGPAGAMLVRRPEVGQALSQGRSAVSGVHSGLGGRAQFGLVVPARYRASDGSVAGGALGAIVDPTNPRFAELVAASLSLGGRTNAEVVDQFGVVVSASQRERTLLSGQFPNFYLPRLQARESGTTVDVPTTGPDAGERYLVAFVPLQRAPWGLALGGPEEEVLAPIRRWDPPMVALGVAALGVLIGLAWLTLRSVVTPVRGLITAARRIAHGDLESRVPAAGSGELGHLAAALDEMRHDLREAQLARDEVDRLKDEFISSVSHELRTPLGYVKGYATTLLRQDAHWDEDTGRECLKIIDESSDQMLEMVDHLLDMSRMSEGKLRVTPEPMPLAPAAREVAQRASVRSSAHRIVCQVPSNLPRVMGDRNRIQQVLGNLIDNAIKYSPEGGTVTVTAGLQGADAVVSVRDEGIGIPEDQLEAVFDRFNRGRHPMVRTIRGAGLGLPICRGIVEAHGGRIWAERAPEGGTLVRFTLPLARAAAPVA